VDEFKLSKVIDEVLTYNCIMADNLQKMRLGKKT